MTSSQEHSLGRMGPGPNQGVWRTLCVALVAVLLFIWPQEWGLENVWGDPLGEADNHLWMFWSAAQGGDWILSNSPEGVSIPLMDPINFPAYWLGEQCGGPLLGWRLMVFGSLGVALLGGYGLARELAGRRGAWIGMVATATAPSLAGFMNFGITESWTLGWVAIHAWMLIAFARRGGAWRAVTAGLALGALALSGWYQALYGLVLEAMLVPVLLWHFRRPGLLLQGLLGLAIAWPSWREFNAVRGAWEARWRMPPPGPPGPRSDWAELPVFGTDLLNFFLPTVGSVQPAKCAYLGWVLIGLVLLGVVKDRVRTSRLVLLSAPFLLLALGPWPTVGGKAVGMAGPAYGLVQIAPDLAGMTHWERAVGAAIPFLAAAAAIGATHLPRRKGVIGGVCLLLVLDSVSFSNAPWPRATYEVQVPTVFEVLPGDGGLIQLPFDNGREEFSEDPARIYTRWQLGHKRPVAENYEGIDAALEGSELLAYTDALCGLRQTIPPYYQVPLNLRPEVPPEGERLAEERSRLRSWGYQWIVLHRDRCPRDIPVIQLLDASLGSGTRLDDQTVAWEL